MSTKIFMPCLEVIYRDMVRASIDSLLQGIPPLVHGKVGQPSHQVQAPRGGSERLHGLDCFQDVLSAVGAATAHQQILLEGLKWMWGVMVGVGIGVGIGVGVGVEGFMSIIGLG